MTSKLKVVCGWCGKDLGHEPCQKRPDGDISHGICKECSEREVRKARIERGLLYARKEEKPMADKKRYRVVAYLRADVEPEEEELYETREEAEKEKEHDEFLQPEHIFKIEEV